MAWRHQRLQSRSLEGRISCDQNCGARTAFAFCELVGIRAEELFWTRLEKLLYTLIEEPDCGEWCGCRPTLFIAPRPLQGVGGCFDRPTETGRREGFKGDLYSFLHEGCE